MDASAVTIRHMLPSQVHHCAEILGACFVDDPFFRWLCPDPTRRLLHARAWMSLSLASGVRRGHTYLAELGPAVLGAMTWSPPGIEIMLADELLSLTSCSAAISGQSMQHFAVLSKVAKIQLQSPHFYLRNIGILKEYRNQGLAARLLQIVHETCDAQGWPSYLETTSEANANLFGRHGYKPLGVAEISADLKFIGLARQPIVK